MLNVWNPIQCRTTLYWSRFVSAYETGTGRGMGTRDSAQDTLGTVHNVPDRARETLDMLWHLQYQDGHTWHQVLPLTGEGGPGLAAEFPDWPQWFSDDHLWLVIGVCAYLRETGDFAYLDEQVAYWDGGEDTIWDHMLRAVDFTLDAPRPARPAAARLLRLGRHDEPRPRQRQGRERLVRAAVLPGHARPGRAVPSTSASAPTPSASARCTTEMAAIINDVAWDGEWYARAYDDDGQPIGVAAEEQHKITLNTQTWAVIGDVAPPERAKQAIDSAHEQLNDRVRARAAVAALRRRATSACAAPPPIRRAPRRTAASSATPTPGPSSPRPSSAGATGPAVLPADPAAVARTDVDRYMVEPYVYCGNICGPEHKQFGNARNAWLSGTATWTYVAGTQWILGIRPTYRGLQIAPALPAEWPGFSATRLFRGVATTSR